MIDNIYLKLTLAITVATMIFFSGYKLGSTIYKNDLLELQKQVEIVSREAVTKARQKEDKWNADMVEVNKAAYDARTKTQAMATANAELTRRLRNAKLPSCASGCKAATTASDTDSNATKGNGVLPVGVDAVERIDTLTREADELNDAYSACLGVVIIDRK